MLPRAPGAGAAKPQTGRLIPDLAECRAGEGRSGTES
jgi:hypothetical protein